MKFQTHAYCDQPDVVLCGNKCDLEEKRVISEERAKDVAQQHGCVKLQQQQKKIIQYKFYKKQYLNFFYFSFR